MGFGEELRKARLARKETCSEVAAATRMKVQVVEDLEDGRLERIAAPIYVKGFIRMYAEHVGLDPQPLVNEYVQALSGERPTLRADVPMKPAASHEGPGLAAHVPEEGQQELFAPPAPPTPDGEPAAGDAPGPRRRVDLSGFASKPPEWLTELGRLARATGAALAGSLGKAAAFLTGLIGRIRLTRISWTPSRIAAAALVAIFLTVVIVSLSIRTAGCSPAPPPKAQPVVEKNLIIAAEPPEPYLD
jgi:hypothetical protein